MQQKQKKVSLTPAQYLFVTSDQYSERAFWGGWGCGKSFAGLLTVLRYNHEIPNNRWWVCRQTLGQAGDMMAEFIDKVLPKDWLVSKNDKEQLVVMKSHLCRHGAGKYCRKCSEIIFKGLDDITKIESANLGGILIDQAEAISMELVDRLGGRLRRMSHLKCGGDIELIYDGTKVTGYRCSNCGDIPESEVSKQYLLTLGNPHPGWPEQRYVLGGINHKKFSDGVSYWEKVLKAKSENKKDKKILVINADTKSNQAHLPEDYIANNSANLDPDMIERMIGGSWKHFAGSALKCMDPAVHFINSFPTDRWEKWMAYDYGVTNPFCLLVFAKCRESGKVYIIDEAYHKGKYLDFQATEIKRLYEKHFHRGEIADLYYDNSMEDIEGNAKSNYIYLMEQIDKLEMYGKINFVRATKSEQAAINLVNVMFKSNKLFVFKDNCPNVVREWPAIRYKERNLATAAKANEPEKLVDRNNHSWDAGVYGLNTEHVDESIIVVRDRKRELYQEGNLSWMDKDYCKYEDEEISQKYQQELSEIEDDIWEIH